MTLGPYGLLLPLLELATVWWLVSRIHYRRYRMLLLYLTVEATSQIITITSCNWWIIAWAASQPFRMTVRAAVVFEVFHLGCIQMSRVEKYWAAAWAAGVSLQCCAVGLYFERLSPLQSFDLFRMWFHLILAAALVGLTAYIWRHPILENRDHRVYRLAMTANMVRMFVGAAFVKGGFGYMIFPYTRHTWQVVDRLSWITMMVLVIALAWGMTSNISCLRPAVAARRMAARLPAAWTVE
jgi:hypothetical protein